MRVARQAIVVACALLLAVQVVRTAVMGAFASIDPGAAEAIWPTYPEIEIASAMTAIGTAAHRGSAVAPQVFQEINAAAKKAPLAAEPYLVRGVQAQLEGNTGLAERAFRAAEWRDPRSLPARYFLADHYLRAGDAQRGLIEYAALARLAPNGIVNVTPFVASYARDRSRWPALRMLFATEPGLQENTLEALARDPGNAEAILALADRAHRNAASPWLPTLLTSMVSRGDYARARAIWRDVAHVHAPPDELLFDADLVKPDPPAPFNWTLTSSTVGLAERQAGGRLHVIYYGQEEGVLASQLLTLPVGTYALAMRVSTTGQPKVQSLHWSLTCANAPSPFATVALDVVASRPWRFAVPPDCGAQRLDLTGSSSDIPQEVEVTLSGMSLTGSGVHG